MKLDRRLSTDGTFAPRAINVLESLPPGRLFHSAYDLRHPVSLYSLSLDKLGQAFKRSIESYQKLTLEHLIQLEPDLKIDNLLRDQEQLLRAQQEHLDDCFAILKTFIDPSTVTKSSRFTEQFVVENKLPGAKTFLAATIQNKVSRRIANKLKHDQAFLRAVAVRPYGRVHLGYFLEEAIGDGVVGPSKAIHPDGGAFSFSRDLSLRFYDIYDCSEKLCVVICATFSALHGIPIQEARSKPMPVWDEVAGHFTRMEENIFPKEAGKIMPKFVLSDSGDRLSIFPQNKTAIKYQGAMPIMSTTVPDRFSNSFIVPFP